MPKKKKKVEAVVLEGVIADSLTDEQNDKLIAGAVENAKYSKYNKIISSPPRDDIDGMPVDPREVTGTDMKMRGGATKAVLLRGKPGSGKTRFFLSHLKLAVKEAYESLYIGKQLDWDKYHLWTDEARAKVREAAKHCMMCIIDMDYQGQDDLVARDSIVPPEIAGSVFKMGVTGLEHKDGIKFYEAIGVRNHLLRKLEWHSKKYPKNRGQRFLILDNTGNLYRDTLDKYFYDTSGGEIKSMREKMQLDEAKNYKKFKEANWKIQGGDDTKVKKTPLFQSGQRDTFRVIDSDYRSFYTDILAVKPGLGFNFYATTHVIEYTKTEGKGENEVKITKEFADGRADDFLSGYFNLVLTFNKVVDYRKDDRNRIVSVDVKGYYVDTAVGAKNRLSIDFMMEINGKGAEEFYAELDRRRQLEEEEFTEGKGTTKQ